MRQEMEGVGRGWGLMEVCVCVVGVGVWGWGWGAFIGVVMAMFQSNTSPCDILI